MKKLILALSAMALLSACATPQMMTREPSVSSLDKAGQIVLAPSRQLSVKVGANGAPALVSEGPSPATELTFDKGAPTAETWAQMDVTSLPPAQNDVVTFHLWTDDRRGTLLVMTNGGHDHLAYLANIVVRENGKLVSHPTTICAVQPGRHGGEIWSFKVVAIEVKQIVALPVPVCVDAQAMDTYYPGQQPPSTIPLKPKGGSAI